MVDTFANVVKNYELRKYIMGGARSGWGRRGGVGVEFSLPGCYVVVCSSGHSALIARCARLRKLSPVGLQCRGGENIAKGEGVQAR